ncbi:uncharacterized protein Z518_01189 [Rhinocladiella mackenziei CBS 650.93]|uniref:25S rRNA adenine-N(1) methyltransferase n=1 Tax=Rhinocladiella mackenziei CBS 650.93 TaxID=1442369 RepID=A0A0D2HHI0_9EURO|nr:uncharacterized protein Z518_01189 [Rhinocladiella mackenziei CBS 650.93]KIX10108.1 hypothetical protein Z518_01189 [Rhinocladiella mackenziei CBS 650.93]
MTEPSNPSSKSKSSTKKTTSSSRSRSKSLKSGRPPLLSSSHPSSHTRGRGGNGSSSLPLSSKHSRILIRTYHVLQKQLAHARAAHDTKRILELEAQLTASGGLKTYQLASTVGQSAERGGDSSRVLIQWLRWEIEIRKQQSSSSNNVNLKHSPGARSKSMPPLKPLRILEVGALSTSNALNVPHATRVRRIDLRSSGPGIEEADLMTFPLPDAPDGKGLWGGEKGYDVLSLSLVLNYVPDAGGRGAMLKRTTRFFSSKYDEYAPDTESQTTPRRQSSHTSESTGADAGFGVEDKHKAMAHASSTSGSKTESESELDSGGIRFLLPCLFLVLPAPTLLNSRYLTPGHLTTIMSSLGYTNLAAKTTRKLHYSLWRYDRRRREEWIRHGGPTVFKKIEINPGGGRNNFCIVLHEHDDEEE